MCMTRTTQQKVTVSDYIAASTRASNVPVRVSDLRVLAEVARLVGSGERA